MGMLKLVTVKNYVLINLTLCLFFLEFVHVGEQLKSKQGD